MKLRQKSPNLFFMIFTQNFKMNQDFIRAYRDFLNDYDENHETVEFYKRQSNRLKISMEYYMMEFVDKKPKKR